MLEGWRARRCEQIPRTTDDTSTRVYNKFVAFQWHMIFRFTFVTHICWALFLCQSVCVCCLCTVHCADHARSRKMFVTLFSFQLLYSNVICHFHASFSGQIGTTDCQEAIKNIICRSLLCGWFNFQFRLFSTFFSVCSHRCSALLFFIFICVELRRRQNRGWSAAYGFGIFVDAI